MMDQVTKCALFIVNFIMNLPRYCDVSLPWYCGIIMADLRQLLLWCFM